MLTYHHYLQNTCSCGRTLNFLTDTLPDELLNPSAEHKGTIEKFYYTTRNYMYESATGHTSAEYQKPCCVYLPYGYSNDKNYDVVFLIHGGGDNETSWLTQLHTFRSTTMNVEQLLDKMLESEFCAPFIAVTFTTYATTAEYGYMDYGEASQLTPEFQNDILPEIIRRYSTYAAGTEPEQITSARDHFAMIGYSNGSLDTFRTGLSDSLPYISWFGCYSGNSGAEPVLEALANIPDEFSIRYLFTSAGDSDTQYRFVTEHYQDLLNGTSRLRDGENAYCCVVNSAGHDWTTWILSLYNSLSVFFR